MQHNFFDEQPQITINRTHFSYSRWKKHTYLIVLITNLSSATVPEVFGVLNWYRM